MDDQRSIVRRHLLIYFPARCRLICEKHPPDQSELDRPRHQPPTNLASGSNAKPALASATRPSTQREQTMRTASGRIIAIEWKRWLSHAPNGGAQPAAKPTCPGPPAPRVEGSGMATTSSSQTNGETRAAVRPSSMLAKGLTPSNGSRNSPACGYAYDVVPVKFQQYRTEQAQGRGRAIGQVSARPDTSEGKSDSMADPGKLQPSLRSDELEFEFADVTLAPKLHDNHQREQPQQHHEGMAGEA